MELKEYTMNEICTTVTDYVANGSFKSLADNVKYLEKGFARLVRLVDFNNNFSDKDGIWVSEESYNFLKKSSLCGNEIIITNVGANLGTVLYMPKLDYPTTLGPNSIMIKTNQNDKFIYYLLFSKYGQIKLNEIRTGSAMPKFNKTDFKKIKISIPNKKIQDKIVKILDSIQNKIEENTQTNDNLLLVS